MKVLVIDDNEDITFSVKMSLEKIDKDYDVIRAHTGAEGLNLAESEKPDIILLDIMIPDMSGWTVSQNLRSNKKTKKIPIIYVTAKGDDISKAIGDQSGVAYITKPFDPNKLNEIIKKALK